MVRIASFNLLSGRSVTDGLVAADRLEAAVRALDVDVLAVQEVDRGQPRSGGADQGAAVGAALGAVAGQFVPTVAGTPGEPGWAPAGHADDSGPAYGIGLYSRLPVAEWHVLRLRPARGRYPLAVPDLATGRPRVLWLPDEPRAAVAAVLAEPRLTVVGTHLSFVPGVNAAQLLRIRRWLAGLPAPRLLVGDLNLPAGVARRITGYTPLVSAPTFPSPAPRLQLDHALASAWPADWSAEGRVREALPISDHRALEVVIER